MVYPSVFHLQSFYEDTPGIFFSTSDAQLINKIVSFLLLQLLHLVLVDCHFAIYLHSGISRLKSAAENSWVHILPDPSLRENWTL